MTELAESAQFMPRPSLTLRLADGDVTPESSVIPRFPVDWDHDESQVAEGEEEPA